MACREETLEDLHLYTREEVADLLGVNSRTVDRWIRSGRLGAFKLGGAVRISAADLSAFLEDHRR